MIIRGENTERKHIQIPRGEKGIATIKSNGETFDENGCLKRIKKRNIEEKIATAAIIRKHNKILITLRKKDSFLEPNKWEFPGGKVEPNETYEECVIREVKKELGITISIDKLFLKTTHIYVKNNQIININLIVFLTDWVDGEVKNIDFQDSIWVDGKELEFYDFVEADIPIIKEFLTLIK